MLTLWNFLTIITCCAAFLRSPGSLLPKVQRLSLSATLNEVPGRGLLKAAVVEHSRDGKKQGDGPQHLPARYWQSLLANVRLWLQPPWRKLSKRAVLKVSLRGSLPLQQPSNGLLSGMSADYAHVESLAELSTLLVLATYDPRVSGLFIHVQPLTCGYGKLAEVRRLLHLFRQSGKEIIGYADSVSEKELYLSMGFSEFYVPPEGSIDTRGFSASATFLRSALDKLGVEPQVQRIGEYKSYGDMFSRGQMSDAQREVVSSVLSQASHHWAEDIAWHTNKSVEQIAQLWSEESVLTPQDYQERGLITGVKYLDEVEAILTSRHHRPGILSTAGRWCRSIVRAIRGRNKTDTALAVYKGSKGSLADEFVAFPRRRLPASGPASINDSSDAAPELTMNLTALTESSRDFCEQKQLHMIPGGLYVRRSRHCWGILPNLPIREVRRGGRIAVINAAGGISTGESSRGGLFGPSLGVDTLTRQLRVAKDDPCIKAVVLRIDSPGGSALASDLLWREIRLVSHRKPVVASMVDVAASGGYYLAMACDQIVAEEMTLTGSIGVVAAKFNAKELLDKLGIGTETISIGRFAEVFTSSRGFTEEEERYFAAMANKSYESFVAKAAASRSMTCEEMEEVAQGRVWTGRQARQRGLVDHLGGLYTALQVAERLTRPKGATAEQDQITRTIAVETMRDPRYAGSPLLRSLLQSSAQAWLAEFGSQLRTSMFARGPQAVDGFATLLPQVAPVMELKWSSLSYSTTTFPP